VWQDAEGTDFDAVQSGHVSVTPLRLDLTDEPAIGRSRAAGRSP
jgi:broad specificity polyphosphatase/5'/3'-nucleotidase SurE